MADDEFHDAVEGDEFDFEPSLERFYDFYDKFHKTFHKDFCQKF